MIKTVILISYMLGFLVTYASIIQSIHHGDLKDIPSIPSDRIGSHVFAFTTSFLWPVFAGRPMIRSLLRRVR